MKNTTLVYLLLFSTNCFGQQRVGIDLNTRGFNLNTSINYQKVFKKQFIYSFGVFGGNYGYNGVEISQEQFESGQRIYSPFHNLNEPIFDTANIEYTLLDYGSKGIGLGLQFGFGAFHEFSIIHGIRFNLNNRVTYVRNKQSTGYISLITEKVFNQIDKTNHFVGAISPEIYHTIRLTGRITFYYGFKFPYFYSIDKGKFNPKYNKDLFNSWEPELSIGLTYVVGKCD